MSNLKTWCMVVLERPGRLLLLHQLGPSELLNFGFSVENRVPQPEPADGRACLPL